MWHLHALGPAVIIAWDVGKHISDSGSEQESLACPFVALCVRRYEGVVVRLTHRLDCRVDEIDRGVASQHLLSRRLAVFLWALMVPGRNSVHVSRQAISIDTRVEDGGRVLRTTKAQRGGKTSRTATDNQNVRSCGSHSRASRGEEEMCGELGSGSGYARQVVGYCGADKVHPQEKSSK